MISKNPDSILQGKAAFLIKQGPAFEYLVIGVILLTNSISWNHPNIDHSLLLIWTISISFITIFKLLVLYGNLNFLKLSLFNINYNEAWYPAFLFFTALTGLTLGAGGIIFNIPGPHIGNILFPAALAGLSLSAAVLFSTCFPAFVMIALFSLLPFGLYSLSLGTLEGVTMGIADVIVLSFTFFAAKRFNVFTMNFLNLQNHILSIIRFMEEARSNIYGSESQVNNDSSLLEEELSPIKHSLHLESIVEANTNELINAYNEDKQNKDRLELAMSASNLGLWDWDLKSDEVYYQNFEGILGYKEDEEPGFMSHLQSLVHPDDFHIIQGAIVEHLRGKTPYYSVQYRVKHKSGNWIWVEDRGKAVEWKNNRATRLIGTHRDISASKQASEQQELTSTVFDNISEGIFVLDSKLRYILVNNYFTKITGYTLSDVHMQTPIEYRHVSESSRQQYEEIYNNLIHTGHWQGELLERRKNGDPYPQWLQVNAIYDDKNQIRQYVGIFTDLTTRKESEEQLSYLANYDSVTGLANRSLFKNRLHSAIDHARQNNSKVALLYIDLDRFKPINDNYGHETGDKILSITAERLTSIMPTADTITRLGSDEFSVIFTNYISRADIVKYCQDFINIMKEPFIVNGVEIALGCSIGVSEYPRNARELQTMLNQADSAMLQSKRLGGNLYNFFTGTWQADSLDKLKLETQLRKAILEDEIIVYYQPKLDLNSGVIDSVEALVRWNHPTEGLLTPNDFVPIAEETGLVANIGEVVLDKACQQIKDWEKIGFANTKISINLSAQQIHKGDTVDVIKNQVEKHQIKPSSLEVELTESILMEEINESIETLDKLRKMGITILLDDFGTGYSSLSYLKKFPIDVLKIDKSFVKDMDSDPDDAAIVKAIIAMAHSLDLEVIAEGVESNEHLNLLKQQGCDGAQGHWVCEPVDGPSITEFLLKQKSAANTA